MLLLALLPSATALAQKTAPHFERPRHNEAVPFIDIISPTAARVHGSGFILILDGAGFGRDAEIGFQLGNINHPLGTVVVNEGEVAAYVPAKLLREADTASITVTNHHRHGESVASNPVLLSITKPTASVAFNETDIDLGQNPGLPGAIVLRTLMETANPTWRSRIPVKRCPSAPPKAPAMSPSCLGGPTALSLWLPPSRLAICPGRLRLEILMETGRSISRSRITAQRR
jgi:hypothetical protein